MRQEAAVDGFRLAYERAGQAGAPAVLLHGWPDPGRRIAVPTTVLWPSRDPLFPEPWSDRIGEFFSAARLTRLEGAGHFTPLERPRDLAEAILAATKR
jgi:pimeloyl-ACP methyl ester carboxylesterase